MIMMELRYLGYYINIQKLMVLWKVIFLDCAYKIVLNLINSNMMRVCSQVSTLYFSIRFYQQLITDTNRYTKTSLCYSTSSYFKATCVTGTTQAVKSKALIIQRPLSEFLRTSQRQNDLQLYQYEFAVHCGTIL